MLKEGKEIVKHFPADTTIYKDKLTFLTDKKIDAELYALLVQYSVGVKNPETGQGETIVYKQSLPTQAEMCKQLPIKSTTTFRAHLKELIVRGYVIDEGTHYILNSYKESVFLKISLDTVAFLNDTVKASVWKVYIYLGQRWLYKGDSYTFTIKELAEHTGGKLSNNEESYRAYNNILLCLKNNGLIDWELVEQKNRHCYRLVKFSFKHKTNT